jgi:hypothetical protein
MQHVPARVIEVTNSIPDHEEGVDAGASARERLPRAITPEASSPLKTPGATGAPEPSGLTRRVRSLHAALPPDRGE